MVRHKTRWLLVRLDFNSDVAIDNNKTGSHNNKSDHKLSIFPSKNELTSQLRQNIVSHFGLVADSVAMDTQGKYMTDNPWHLVRISTAAA